MEGGGIDSDPEETADWLESLAAVVGESGRERGRFLLSALENRARELGLPAHTPPGSAYQNTIPVERQPPYPGDEVLEHRITSIVRWNALAMVIRANKAFGELGGHIASYASGAEIFEVGFNHFFRGEEAPGGGDLVFFQPHSAPGVYARAYLEGRLSDEQLGNFRREIGGAGLSSYCHPWLMPSFWQFPTGSMGLGPITAVHHGRFMRYLQDRGLADTEGRRVWGIFGDGEMDEPESLAAVAVAGRERLDNVTFVLNCNLQRLDGPVRGNGRIVDELEALFSGAGWNVIKVLWGSNWDLLFAQDAKGALVRRFATMVDGELQMLGANDGAFNRERFFDRDPELRALVAHMTADEIDALRRGGHDTRKLHAALRAAADHRGRPTVILAATKKGYGMGRAGESRMTTHQQKKLDVDALLEFRDRFGLPLDDEEVAELRFLRPAEDGPELTYIRERRRALGGAVPARREQAPPVAVPALDSYARFALEAEGKSMSTTVAAVRALGNLLKDRVLGPRVVPIVADEARTFGMANLFRQVGIYSAVGQLYEPEDAGSMLYYREARDGQLLEEGISEAGALSSWVAAGTSYSAHGVPMLPVYFFYSMFGFQRVGDLIWAAADQRTRGFLFGATSGRTTLSGEGLQHQDGTSHVIAATIPTCRAYDPAYAYEVAVILDHGAREMMERQRDVFYYVTVTNENYAQPSLPPGSEADIVRGMHLVGEPGDGPARANLLGSGAILGEVLAAARMLAEDWGVASRVWSVTSYSELAREAAECERWNRLHPDLPERRSFVERRLGRATPVIAASDYVRAYPQLIASTVDRLTALGTDGFGRSDTRAGLRSFFEVDRAQVTVATLAAAAAAGDLPRSTVAAAIERYGVDVEAAPPWTR
ncbi:MAG TPA: alpha-ketoglutarate dehydrogenase [Candidatus Dormibacteraeota bacterium]|nr:alpha-ketoglutarate dehydrogenase [Candidatus Dormibacteraeota bacterium]